MIFSFEEDKSIQIQQTWYTFISKNLQITEKLRIFAPDHRQKALKTVKIQQKTAIFRDRCNNLRTFRYIYTRKLKAPVG